VSGICLTKLDVLDGIETIKVCTGYKGIDPDTSSSLMNMDSYEKLEPVYVELPGWTESTVGAKSLDQLPKNALAYIRYIEKIIEAPVDIISTGPDREETIILRHPFGA
jgi:adenylosuccinate synthase